MTNSLLTLFESFAQLIILLIFCLIGLFLIKNKFKQKTSKTASKFKVKDAMLPLKDILCFEHGTSISSILPRILKSYQEDFPVMHSDSVIGIIKKNKILQSIAEGEQSYISSLMDRDFHSISPEIKLNEALTYFDLHKTNILVVVEENKSIGILAKDILIEFVFIMSIKAKQDKINI